MLTATTDPCCSGERERCLRALDGKRLWSSAFIELSKKNDNSLHWMLRPPLRFRPLASASCAAEEHMLLLLNHELEMVGVLIPNITRALHATHPAMRRMREVGDLMATTEGIGALRMASGRRFVEWMGAHQAADKHSQEEMNIHDWEAWHVCTAANEHVVTQRKSGDDPGAVTPIKHVPRDEALWRDAVHTFVTPFLPAILATRDMLPPSVRPRVMKKWQSCETEMQYVGINFMPSKEMGWEQFCWEGVCNPRTGEHQGIAVHPDKNNAEGKLALVLVFGCFEGFAQLLVPFGVAVDCPNLGALWMEFRALHAVFPGSGCRISYDTHTDVKLGPPRLPAAADACRKAR